MCTLCPQDLNLDTTFSCMCVCVCVCCAQFTYRIQIPPCVRVGVRVCMCVCMCVCVVVVVCACVCLGGCGGGWVVRVRSFVSKTWNGVDESGIGRNAEGRLRVQAIDVVLQLGQSAASLQQLDRALAQFEDFCTVTQSVRTGIDVKVQVRDATGARLK